MPRYIRKVIILAKSEVTYALDPTPTGAANAILATNLSINPLNATNVDRDLNTGYMGNYQQLVAAANVQCGFDVELVGSGAAGTAPAFGPLLKACALAETVTAVTRVDYTPITDAIGSVTIYWYDDGLLHKITGARGDVTFKLGVNSRPVMSFSFTGLYTAVTAAGNPTPTYTAFKVPEAVSDPNTGDITLGATHSAAGAPTLTGGTAYPSTGIEISLGNQVNHNPLLGGESVEIVDRSPSCNFQLDLTAAQEVTLMGNVTANTLQSVGLQHGLVVGNKVLTFMPQVQLINPSKQEMQGKRLIGFEGRLVPNLGNDEFRVAFF